MGTWVENFLNACINQQSKVINEVPIEKREAGYGRASKLIIDGPHGAIMDLWFCKDGIQRKPDGIPLKNTVYMKEDTFLDLTVPDIDIDDLRGRIQQGKTLEQLSNSLFARLDFRTAMANGLIAISGEKADYDSEEWAQLLETFLTKIAFPFMLRTKLSQEVKKNAR